ncbi:hypothetical protein ACHAWF_018264 [Thalassiosira exigua]
MNMRAFVSVIVTLAWGSGDGFTAPNRRAPVAHHNDCDEFPKDSHKDVLSNFDGNCRESVSESTEHQGVLDRRRFVFSVVVAASVFAQSDDVDATVPVQTEPVTGVGFPTESLASTGAETSSAAPPAIDGRAIIGKAAKKALGGGKGNRGSGGSGSSLLSDVAEDKYELPISVWGNAVFFIERIIQRRGNWTALSRIAICHCSRPAGKFRSCLSANEFELRSKCTMLLQNTCSFKTRFGDTAANVGVLALLESIPETQGLPLPLKTAAGSITAGLWRIVLMPIDTSKTAMQVEGQGGLDRLKQQVVENGPAPLYQGALASAAATAAGHFPWFLTYNFLNDALPIINKDDDLLLFLVRSAALGLSASCVSDCVSNSLRVIKTTKQTAGLGDGGREFTYKEALTLVLENDGVVGLFGRGLQTRLLTNAIQGAIFSVTWKYFQATL